MTQLTLMLATILLLVSPARATLDHANYDDQDLACLSETVYREAATEGFQGKIAVAQIVMNRLKSGQHGKSVCSVVYQREYLEHGRVLCQFSWTCLPSNRLRPLQGKPWYDSQRAAAKILRGQDMISALRHAMYFRNRRLGPMPGSVRVAEIGNHVFYMDPA